MPSYRWSTSEFLPADLTTKVRIYGAAGWPVYWVVSPEAVYVHTEPTPEGYRLREEYRAGDQLPVGYAGALLSVDELLRPSA